MAESNVIAPVVNINGTSAEELLNQLQGASEAISIAFKALQEAYPHGRDYQTAPQGTYQQAREQYNVWFGQLNDIKEALGQIGNEIWKQKR